MSLEADFSLAEAPGEDPASYASTQEPWTLCNNEGVLF